MFSFLMNSATAEADDYGNDMMVLSSANKWELKEQQKACVCSVDLQMYVHSNSMSLLRRN